MDRPRRRAGLIALALSACRAPPDPLQTVSLRGTFALLAEDDATTLATAVLRDRHGDPVLIEATGEVQVALPGWQVELIPYPAEPPYYQATVPAVAPGAEHVVSILRPERRSAVNRVVLPEPPDLVLPATWSRDGEPLALWWTPDPDATLRVEIRGDCVEPLELDLDDGAGAGEVPAGALAGAGACTLDLVATRTRGGTLSDVLRGGRIEASQRRAFELYSTL